MVLEVPSQFSMGQTVQSLTCSIMENHIQGWMTDLNMLLSCFREKMSGLPPTDCFKIVSDIPDSYYGLELIFVF